MTALTETGFYESAEITKVEKHSDRTDLTLFGDEIEDTVITHPDCLLSEGDQILAKQSTLELTVPASAEVSATSNYMNKPDGGVHTSLRITGPHLGGEYVLPSVEEGPLFLIVGSEVPPKIDTGGGMLTRTYAKIFFLSIVSDICKSCPALMQCAPGKVGRLEELRTKQLDQE